MEAGTCGGPHGIRGRVTAAATPLQGAWVIITGPTPIQQASSPESEGDPDGRFGRLLIFGLPQGSYPRRW